MRRNTISRLATVAVAATTLMTLTGPANAAAWRVARTPYQVLSNVPYAPLASVSAVSSANVWAVGRDDGSMLTEHWNGSSWTSVAVPNGPCDVFESNCQLTSVSADSGSDVVAVGNGILNAGTGWLAAALAFRWNGSGWQAMPLPSGLPYMALEHVKAFSPTNAWAVGVDSGGTQSAAAVTHWDGSAWTRIASPFTTPLTLDMKAVAGSSAKDVWAVGQTRSSGYHNVVRHTVILHFDGVSWSQASAPDTGGLIDVAALSPTNAWALSWDGRVLHWDGVAWTVNTQFYGGSAIAAVSPTDVSVAGVFVNSTLAVAHYNGSSWTTAPAPTGISVLTGGAALPTGGVWFSGYNYDANGATSPAVLSNG